MGFVFQLSSQRKWVPVLLTIFQGSLEKVIDKPAVKPLRSYDSVGRPTKDFDAKSEEGRRLIAREILAKAPTDSCLAIYKAAKLKAEDEFHEDSAFILSKIYENPIENGASIRAAMKGAEKEGIIIIYN